MKKYFSKSIFVITTTKEDKKLFFFFKSVIYLEMIFIKKKVKTVIF